MPLQKDLSTLLNKYSRETVSNTPDFILANFLLDCLTAWEKATSKRDKWWDFLPGPHCTQGKLND